MTTRDLLLEKSNPCLHAHVLALRSNETKYLEALRELSEMGAMSDVSSATKATILAALSICSVRKPIDALLLHCDVTTIVKALTQLDRPRLLRQLEKKVQKIENDPGKDTRPDPVVMQKGLEALCRITRPDQREMIAGDTCRQYQPGTSV